MTKSGRCCAQDDKKRRGLQGVEKVFGGWGMISYALLEDSDVSSIYRTNVLPKKKWRNVMKTIEISEELWERLKMCVVDPFDDTPELVINRLVDIVDKAKSVCSSWDEGEESVVVEAEEVSAEQGQQRSWNKQAEATL